MVKGNNPFTVFYDMERSAVILSRWCKEFGTKEQRNIASNLVDILREVRPVFPDPYPQRELPPPPKYGKLYDAKGKRILNPRE